jgi:hypothetical protein
MHRTKLLVFGVFVLVNAAVWGRDILADQSIKLAVVSPAPLYSLPPIDAPTENAIVLTVSPGQSLKVLRMRYGKDFQTFKVETETGSVGWVVCGEGIQVKEGA